MRSLYVASMLLLVTALLTGCGGGGYSDGSSSKTGDPGNASMESEAGSATKTDESGSGTAATEAGSSAK